MTFKKYLKDRIANSLLNNEIINFEEYFKKYNEFKEVGNHIITNYEIEKIKVNKETIVIPKDFINKNLTRNYELANLISKSPNKNINDSILINVVIDAFKKIINNKSKVSIEELNNPYILFLEKANYETFMSLLPEAIKKYKKENSLNNLSEELEKKKNEVIEYENCLVFYDEKSLFFHFFISEVVYYVLEINGNNKKPKLCSICHGPNYSKSKYCDYCNIIRINNRRNANKKCKLIRNTLNIYSEKYIDVIPKKLQNEIHEMIDDKSKYKHTDLKPLIKLKEDVEKIIKKEIEKE